ncbi:MAG: hypothetical protein WA154_14430 [Moraxellaceae bacterium]
MTNMAIEIYVNCDGDWSRPEVKTSGSAASLAALGLFFNEGTESAILDVPVLESKFYRFSINLIKIEIAKNSNDRLAIEVNENNLHLSGSKLAFNKLADSLINFFDSTSEEGEHFHLDYYEENQILNKTNCHLIFVCSG